MFPEFLIRDSNSALNTIRLAQARKRLHFRLMLDRCDIPLLRLLYRVGAIRSFRLRSPNLHMVRWEAQISLHYYRGSSFWHISTLLTRRGRQIAITYGALRLLVRRLGASLVILATPSGLRTSEEALRYREGGLVVFFIL